MTFHIDIYSNPFMNKYICTNRTKEYQNEVKNILNTRKQEILDFFELDKKIDLNFNVYIYDTIEELIEGLNKRGFKNFPDYICACQKDEDNSLNFFEPKDNPNDQEWSKEEYKSVIFHELIHAIQYQIYKSQPEWLTEGVAKYLDGTYSKGIKWLLENYIHKNKIPTMYELENEFGMHDYDSYDYAYLMVSYLIEKLGKKQFLEIMKQEPNLKSKTHNLVKEALDYYNNKYFPHTKTTIMQ